MRALGRIGLVAMAAAAVLTRPPAAAADTFKITVSAGHGVQLPWIRLIKEFYIPEVDKRTEDDWVQRGNDQELNGRLLQALQTYQDALAKFPDSFDLRKAAGRLCAGLLRFQEAQTYFEPVQGRDTSDLEISYYLGLAYDGLGKTRDAREAYRSAYRLPAFRAAAGLRLAELSARESNLILAESYLQEVRQVAPGDLRMAEELIAVLRAENKTSEADKLAQEWLARTSRMWTERLNSLDRYLKENP